MMTRTAPVVPLSPRRVAQVALAAFAVTSAMLAVPSFSDEQRPISDFLHRAQTKVDAESFEQLMVRLGTKRGSSQSHQAEKAPVDKPTTSPTTPVVQPPTQPPQPLLQKVMQLPAVTIIDKAEAQEIKTTKKNVSSPSRKRSRNVHAARQPAGAWAHRVSGILRQAGVRF
jgi:hypothetical protein